MVVQATPEQCLHWHPQKIRYPHSSLTSLSTFSAEIKISVFSSTSMILGAGGSPHEQISTFCFHLAAAVFETAGFPL
jgi:hypothetical protein